MCPCLDAVESCRVGFVYKSTARLHVTVTPLRVLNMSLGVLCGLFAVRQVLKLVSTSSLQLTVTEVGHSSQFLGLMLASFAAGIIGPCLGGFAVVPLSIFFLLYPQHPTDMRTFTCVIASCISIFSVGGQLVLIDLDAVESCLVGFVYKSTARLHEQLPSCRGATS